MKNITDPSEIRSVVVFRALNLGDMLCAVPALRALRHWLPKARIAYIGLPWSRGFFSRFSRYLDEFIEFPGYPGLPEIEPDPGRIPEFIGRVQEARFDLSLQMHGSGTVTNPLVSLFRASVMAGFCLEGNFFPRDGWPVPYPDHLPETGRCLELVRSLGAEESDDSLEFPLTENDFAELKELPEAARLKPGSYIVVHPGSRSRVRRWGAGGFARVCDTLAEEEDLSVMITGSSAEWDIAERVRRRMSRPACNLAGRTTMGALGALVKDCRVVIANDTGVSHMADALRAPSVIVVTASDPLRWSPRDGLLHSVIKHDVPCRPCSFPVCPIGHPCSREIDPDDVLAAARKTASGNGKSLLSTAAE